MVSKVGVVKVFFRTETSKKITHVACILIGCHASLVLWHLLVFENRKGPFFQLGTEKKLTLVQIIWR